MKYFPLGQEPKGETITIELESTLSAHNFGQELLKYMSKDGHEVNPFYLEFTGRVGKSTKKPVYRVVLSKEDSEMATLLVIAFS